MGNNIIRGKRIYLRPVRIEDANKDYHSWMNDPEVTEYTESRFHPSSIEDIKTYLEKESKSEGSVFLAIVLKENDKHIGNIKIHRIDPNHRNAEIALLIGEKSYWGQGIGGEAVKLMVNHVFKSLKLHKIYARCYANNTGSIKMFKKAGFKEEGRMKKHYVSNGKFVDGVFLGILNNAEGKQ